MTDKWCKTRCWNQRTCFFFFVVSKSPQLLLYSLCQGNIYVILAAERQMQAKCQPHSLFPSRHISPIELLKHIRQHTCTIHPKDSHGPCLYIFHQIFTFACSVFPVYVRREDNGGAWAQLRLCVHWMSQGGMEEWKRCKGLACHSLGTVTGFMDLCASGEAVE